MRRARAVIAAGVLYRRAFSGRAGQLCQAIADSQLEGVRADFADYVRAENAYNADAATRELVDRDEPVIARWIRNGRLAAAFYERLVIWRGEAGEAGAP